MSEVEISTLTKVRNNLDQTETRVRLLHYLEICDSVPLFQVYEKAIPNLVASAQGFMRVNPVRAVELRLEVRNFLTPDLRQQSPEQQKILFGKHVLGLILTEEEWEVYTRVNALVGSLAAKNQQVPLRQLNKEDYDDTLRETLVENGFGYRGEIPTDGIVDVIESITELIQKM